MATYFNYKGREGKDQVNWQGITKGISDNITKIQGERQQQRVDIDKNITESLEYAANKPQGQDTLQNGIISDFASQAEATLLQAQKDLKSGRIKLRDFTALTNNSVSGTKKMFALSEKYQQNYKTNMERLQADPKTGLTAGSGISAVLGSNLEAMGNMVNTKYFMDPKTGETFIAQMAKDGDSNTRVIDGKAMSLMNISEAEGLITRQIDRYQAGTVSDGLSEALGRDVAVVRGLYPDIKTNEDAFSKLITRKADGTIDYDNLPSAGKAIMLNIQGTMSEDIQVASMLFDTMDGYIMVGQNQDGSFINLNKTRNDKGEMVNEVIDELTDKTVLMKQDDRNQYQPDFSGERGMRQRRAAENGVLSMMEDNLDTIEVATVDKGMNDAQKEAARLAREKLKLDKEEGKGGEKTAMSNLTKLFYGGEKDAAAAAQFIRGLDKNENLQIKLDGTNMILTRTLEDGSTEVETISKEGGVRNFIESASTFLNLGIDDVQKAMSASGALTDKDGNDLVMNPISLDSSSVINKKISTIDQIQDKINTDVNNFAISADQVKDESKLRETLAPLVAQYGIQVSEEEPGSDVISFTISGREPLTIPLKNVTPEIIKEAIKGLINSDVNKDTLLSYKAKLRNTTAVPAAGGAGETGGNVRGD